ncbi:MAG: hypothetical protein NDI94_00525 [Candidatus Woesearchaeota archaeon]|nr:hypothetical protein [Candidatus Woesearchaeota archaeon]
MNEYYSSMDRELHDYSSNKNYSAHDSGGGDSHGGGHDSHSTGSHDSHASSSHDSGHGGSLHDAHQTGHHSHEIKEVDSNMDIGIDEWGTTTNPFEHQTEALKARIFHGASRIEFTFFGAGKGRKEQSTPETFGKREREDMRALAEINEVQTTTHATVGIQGLSGLNMQQGMFSDDQRKRSIDEIKRAIHFAAEATTGGAIVFHTGEAPRYMHGRQWNGDKGVEFEMYPEENERKVTYLTDPKTKRLVAQVSGVDRIAVPKFRLDEKKNVIYLRDENGNEVVDENLKPYDRLHGGKQPLYETDKDGDIQTEIMDFNRFKKEREEYYKKYPDKKPEKESMEEAITKDFFYQQKFVDVMYSLNFGIRSEREYNELLNHRNDIIKSLKYYTELKKRVPEDDWWKFKKQAQAHSRAQGMGLIPPEDMDPVEYLQKELKDNERTIAYTKELALHGRRTATEQLDVVKRSMLADKFAVDESARSMGEIGVYTWEMNERGKKKQGDTQFKLKNDLYLAPENLFPEMYGSHPDELKTLVLRGREEMAKQLQSRYKMDAHKAKELSEKHIKATFDIAHANIWKKYFKSNPDESLEGRDKRFNEWLLKKTKQLFKEGIIGHVHISDNFGFDDEHLIAGDGTVPIKEFVKQAKEQGFKEFIVESGSFNAMTSLPDTWMHFDSPVYGIQVPGFTHDKWTDPGVGSMNGFTNFYRSHFGRTEGPRYLVGETAPSEEFKGSPFYTGMPME